MKNPHPRAKKKDKQTPFEYKYYYFFLLLLAAGYLYFHPDDWHRTWVSRRCLHQQLQFFIASLSLFMDVQSTCFHFFFLKVAKHERLRFIL